jgi:hypothetical protein
MLIEEAVLSSPRGLAGLDFFLSRCSPVDLKSKKNALIDKHFT